MSFEEVWPDFFLSCLLEKLCPVFSRGIVAAVHPFPEIWTQPNLGVYNSEGWMFMDLVSLSFWS